MKNIILKANDGLEIKCYLYEPKNKPKASVLVVHGMQEHAGRYVEFCEFLTSHGYAVLAPDLRGHGHTAESKQLLGHSSGDIYLKTLDDLKMMTAWLKKSYSAPVNVFSHSYGSMLTQRLMQIDPIPQNFVLCGTGNGEAFLMKLANVLTKKLAKNHEEENATAVENLSFKSYAKKFKGGNWLSRDESVMKKYNEDELCGGSFPYSFYKSLFSNLRNCNKGIGEIPKDKSIFLIAGTKDPVSQGAKQVKQLYKKYKKSGLNVQMKLYKNARHELLNELNKATVFEDILRFFEA